VPEAARAASLFSPVRVRAAILVFLTAVVFYLCWIMIRPFLAVITWAAALAILAHPLHAWLEHRMRPNAAALIAVGLVTVIVVAPAIFLTQRLFAELSDGLRAVGTGLSSANLYARLQQNPTMANILNWIETRPDLDQIRAALGSVAGKVSAWVSGSVWFLTQLVLTFLTLFYFFRDRTHLLRFFRRFTPLSATETDEMFDRISRTVNASLYRNLLVKLIQGFLGGLMFWILGLPAPVLCGAAMALFAVLPVMGTAIVWAPAAIALALSGSWVKALVLAIWGAFIVGLIDNFLYPILVAGELRFHPLSVFFAVFGGLLAFGISGVVLGPVILAIAVALMEIWQLRTGGAIQATED
jgi:predicted PurR-regulated permease PerM